jgi:hypothetical protein
MCDTRSHREIPFEEIAQLSRTFRTPILCVEGQEAICIRMAPEIHAIRTESLVPEMRKAHHRYRSEFHEGKSDKDLLHVLMRKVASKPPLVDVSERGRLRSESHVDTKLHTEYVPL